MALKDLKALQVSQNVYSVHLQLLSSNSVQGGAQIHDPESKSFSSID